MLRPSPFCFGFWAMGTVMEEGLDLRLAVFAWSTHLGLCCACAGCCLLSPFAAFCRTRTVRWNEHERTLGVAGLKTVNTKGGKAGALQCPGLRQMPKKAGALNRPGVGRCFLPNRMRGNRGCPPALARRVSCFLHSFARARTPFFVEQSVGLSAVAMFFCPNPPLRVRPRLLNRSSCSGILRFGQDT